jgi:hypothetical protein
MAILAGNNFNVKDFAPALWLDAADSNTLYDATTGGALVGAGGAVARWEDKSGNGRHATQVTLSNRPTRTVGAQNTRDALRFNGTNHFLSYDGSFLANTNYTIFISVARLRDTANYFIGGLDGTENGNLHLGWRNSTTLAHAQYINDYIMTVSGYTSPVYHVFTFSHNTTTGKRTHSNGSQIGSRANTASLTTYNGAMIGRYLSGGSSFAGDVAEIIMLPYTATDAQRQSIERYLANKWGLGFNPLSLSPALWLDASDSNTLYDATTGGALVGAGGTVARWEDKSGNARHATQATLANQPLRTAAAQGGKDALTFDGVNDFMATPAFGGTQDCTYFLVTASKNATQNKVFAAHANNYANPPLGANYVAVNAARLETAQNGASGTTKFTSKLAASQNLQNNIFRIVGVQLTSTNAGHIQRVNGAAHTTTNAYPQDPGVFTKAAQSFGVGAYNGGSYQCHCDIAELIYFTKLLTASERQAVERYLAQKWNIIT